MQKEQASRDLRDLVEALVSDAFKDAAEQADAHWGHPHKFNEVVFDLWNRIIGVKLAAIRLELKDPTCYRSKRYSIRILHRDLWNTVKKHKGRRA